MPIGQCRLPSMPDPLDAVAVALAASSVAIALAGSFDGVDGSLSALPATLLAAVLARLWRPSPPTQKDGSSVPGPVQYPFIGATVELNDNFDDYLNWLVSHCARIGWGTTWGFTTLRIGALGRGAVYLATPAAVQHVLKDNFENYVKGDPFRDLLGEFLGEGIFACEHTSGPHHNWISKDVSDRFRFPVIAISADGLAWSVHRMLKNDFLLKNDGFLLGNDDLCTNIQAKSRSRCSRSVCWRKAPLLHWPNAQSSPSGSIATYISKQSPPQLVSPGILIERLWCVQAESGEPIELQSCYFAFTMDTFCEIAFGTSLTSQVSHHEFSAAIDRCQLLCNDRIRNPAFKVNKYLKTAAEAEITSTAATMRSFALGIVKGRRRELANGEQLGPDLISRFISSTAEGEEGFSDDELIDIVLNFLIAGRDTTACALSWASLRVIRSDEARRRLREEVSTAVRGLSDCNGSGELQGLPHDVAFELVHRGLPYTRAVMSEALRLNPSVPKDAKFSKQADTLPDGTKVGPGVAMLWSNYAMGRNPLLWPDPLKFKPERWLSGASLTS